MASPTDTFKNSVFGQLKSYSDAVQGVFEQRIARPLLALKRDFSRSSSTTRTPSDQESVLPSQQTSFLTDQELMSSSSTLEIIDIETSSSLKTILDKVKDTISPSTKRRTSDDFPIDNTRRPSREQRRSSISSLSNKVHRKPPLRHHKSVSFAENIQYDHDNNSNTDPFIDDRKEIERNAHTLADRILMTSIDEATSCQVNPMNLLSNYDDNDSDFQRRFYQTIRPRRISIGNSKDLVYQDLSAEIVAYVLKHALRALEKEDEDLLIAENQKLFDKNEEDDDFIDLK